MTTFGLVAKFAGTKYEVNDKNDLQPGDIIICNGIQHVDFSHHLVIIHMSFPYIRKIKL